MTTSMSLNMTASEALAAYSVGPAVFAVGAPVDVRNRFVGSWSRGFEIAATGRSRLPDPASFRPEHPARRPRVRRGRDPADDVVSPACSAPSATTTADPPTTTRSILSADPCALANRVEGLPISAPWLISICSTEGDPAVLRQVHG